MSQTKGILDLLILNQRRISPGSKPAQSLRHPGFRIIIGHSAMYFHLWKHIAPPALLIRTIAALLNSFTGYLPACLPDHRIQTLKQNFHPWSPTASATRSAHQIHPLMYILRPSPNSHSAIPARYWSCCRKPNLISIVYIQKASPWYRYFAVPLSKYNTMRRHKFLDGLGKDHTFLSVQ